MADRENLARRFREIRRALAITNADKMRKQQHGMMTIIVQPTVVIVEMVR